VSRVTESGFMIFIETKLKGAFAIEIERKEDFRGFFARTFCRHEFSHHGLKTQFVQCSISYNERKGTLRGMHFQSAPMQEAKLIRCTRGSIFDAIIDLRRDSPTYKKHFTIELTAETGSALYIPEGFAHGFQTLEDGTEVLYQMTEFFAPDLARGVRWNDPAFGIRWPEVDNRIILDRDQSYALFSD
jgi:dTDP-4-dehydrorhamnose 3,5-epimerase